MRITLVKVENFQCLKSVEIVPGDRNLLCVGGKNRQGKTSLLRAMKAALRSKEAPDRPVRDGEDTADIRIELDGGEIVIAKTFFVDGRAKLEVRSEKLGKLSSPQKVLDGIVGSYFLDPLAFTRLSEKEQRAKLLEVADIGIDLDANAKQRKTTFDKRTEVNRDGKRLAAEIGAVKDPGEIPAKKDLAALLAKLDGLQETEKAATEAGVRLEQHDVAVSRATLAFGEMQSELDAVKLRLGCASEKLDSAEKARADAKTALEGVAAANVDEEVAALRSELVEVDEHNAGVAKLENDKAAHDRLQGEIKVARVESKNLSSKLVKLDKAKSDALAEAKMPVPGLDIDGSSVLLNGVPLSQASGAEQLILSLAIAVAMSPDLRDIWIEDGSLLDEDSLKIVADFAAEKDYQVWIERVGDSDDDCIVIEDGMVRA